MKRSGIIAGIFLVVCLAFTCVQAHAAGIPQLINYQGTLTDSKGPVKGQHKLTFKIYTDAIKTDSQYLSWGPKTFPVVSFTDGSFNVILENDDGGKSVTGAFISDKTYLEITIDNNDNPIKPRQRILSAPYAMVAEQAAKADSATKAEKADSATKAETVEGTNLYVNSTNGNVGIGTTNPSEKFEVNGTAKISGGLKPDYNSGWFPVDSYSEHTVTLTHNFGSIPSRFTLQFSPDNPPSGYVYDMTGNNWYDGSGPGGANAALHSGSVRFTVSQMEIPLWPGGVVGRYRTSTPEWLVWKTGFYRVLLWK